jgi:hypothetical protein
MSTRIVSITLLSAVLLSSYPDVRPEVAQPLNEAMHLSGYWSPNKAAIMAKLNQAASMPNLTSDEQYKISAAAAIALAKGPQGIPEEGLERPDTRDVTQATGPFNPDFVQSAPGPHPQP